MGYRLGVAVAVVLAAELVTVVLGNYSLATGGGHAAADQMRGDTRSASRRMAHAAEESKEVIEKWAGWAKDKAQEGLGFCADHSVGSSGVTQEIADKTRKGKDKVYDAVSGAAQMASEKAQQAKDVIYDSAKEAICKVQNTEEAQDNTMEDSKGEEAQAQERGKAQENLSWPKHGYKRKASDHLADARKKISLGGSSHSVGL